MNTLTIPKTIHYCWFGKNDLPPLVKKCIKSWHKYLPDYEFKLWDEQSFDITSNKWCQEAYKQKKYAFVADYVRLKVLYEQGGIYLDTDIQLYKSLNPFLSNEAFMGFERDEILSMGVMGFKKNNKIIKELLDYYDQEFNLNIVNKLESNANITTQFLSEKYGLSRNNAKQIIENINIYPKTFFNPMDYFGNWDKSPETVCVHLYMGSWLPEQEQKKLKRRKTFIFKLTKYIWDQSKNNPLFKRIRLYLKNKNII